MNGTNNNLGSGVAAVRDGIDHNEIIIISNVSSAAQERFEETKQCKVKAWTHRTLSWKVIAENAIAFGDDSAIKNFPEALEGKSAAAIYQALPCW